MPPSRGILCSTASLLLASLFSVSHGCSSAISPAAYTKRLRNQQIDQMLLKDHKVLSRSRVRRDFQLKLQS